MSARRALVIGVVLIAAAGCGDDGPADGSAGGSPAAGGHDGMNLPPATAKPSSPKRTIIERSPFGNVQAASNLLWDGDFEWSSPFSDQYGWLEPPSSLTLSDVVVGPACRSGVKCARVKKANDILGVAVGSATEPLVASVYVRFETGPGEASPPCSKVEASIIDAETLLDAVQPNLSQDFELTPESEQPGEDGWCKLAGLVPAQPHKPYFRVDNNAPFPMLVDDAVLLAESQTRTPLPPPAIPIDPSTKSEAQRERARRAKAFAIASRGPHDGAPDPVRDALEAFGRRPRKPALLR